MIGGIPTSNVFMRPTHIKGINYTTGGINATNLEDYLAEASVLCVGGTWIADKHLIDTETGNKLLIMRVPR